MTNSAEFEVQSAALPLIIREHMERVLKTDLSRIRVHRSPLATAVNRVRGRRAFLVGDRVYVRDPKLDLESPDGHSVLVEELVHFAGM
jgi:hypothetical protein